MTSDESPTIGQTQARPSLADVAAQMESQASADADVPQESGAGEAPSAAHPPATPPRTVRVADGAWLGGVCTGLSAHLGWPLLAVRVGFVLLASVQLVGALVYAALWLVLPPETSGAAPGIDAASRTGMRTQAAQKRGDIWEKVALGTLFAGLTWLFQSLGLASRFVVPYWSLLVGAVGVAVVWRQLDTLRHPPDAPRSALSWLGIVAGASLVGAAVVMAVVLRVGLATLPSTMWVAGTVFAATLALVLPWAFRARRVVTTAREQELQAQARADVAAHLHDSVLQTLALIQRQADDPRAVKMLARQQERELRDWLYGEGQDPTTFSAAMAAAAADVETNLAVKIDLVVVGDHEIDPGLDAVVRASREAMINAAKHSGASRIDVYAEVGSRMTEVFIRDRGRGFDIDSVEADRMGIRGSIIDRIERHGGEARLRSSPDGTEVRLTMATG